MALRNLQSRVVNTVGVARLVRRVRLVVVARFGEIVLVREHDLIRLLDVLHAESFTNVPCNVAVLFRQFWSVRCVYNVLGALHLLTISHAPGLFELNAIASQPPAGRVAVSLRTGLFQFRFADDSL